MLGLYGKCSHTTVLWHVRKRLRNVRRVPPAVMIPPSEVRSVEKSAFRSDGTGPRTVRNRPQRAPRTDTADSVFEKSGSDRVADGSWVLSAVQVFGGVTGQYQRRKPETASDDATSGVRDRQETQLSATPGTLRQPLRNTFRLRCDSTAQPVDPAQKQPDQSAYSVPSRLRVGRHPAVMPDFAKSLGQHVLQKSAHKLLARDSPCPDLLRPGRCPVVLDALLSAVHDPIVADGDSVHIRRQILQHGFAVAHGLDADLPPAVPHGRIDVGLQALQAADWRSVCVGSCVSCSWLVWCT